MNKIVQELELKLTGSERNRRNSEEQGAGRSELSKSRKNDNDSPIYRLPKEERPNRSARIPDRMGCSIEQHVRSASLFDR
ncbi:hypothetical protein HanHA300_Chr10g0354261 [Helianthus annuus]|nr:hypothetical protein HanHA300_Chr10g0354261 [Helianthus annuus]KAJ0529285.1 hypothetical protein HanHA89_Chr10g0375951 [Helianthus annuus]KAJ0696167.1 hypothetical protein HanLR1_Chr10g0353811 [Helianthus annuus]